MLRMPYDAYALCMRCAVYALRCACARLYMSYDTHVFCCVCTSRRMRFATYALRCVYYSLRMHFEAHALYCARAAHTPCCDGLVCAPTTSAHSLRSARDARKYTVLCVRQKQNLKRKFTNKKIKKKFQNFFFAIDWMVLARTNPNRSVLH